MARDRSRAVAVAVAVAFAVVVAVAVTLLSGGRQCHPGCILWETIIIPICI